METAKTEVKKTLRMEDVLRLASRYPFKTFEEWPILDVRRECLKKMNEEGCIWTIYSETADWAERIIDDLVKQHDETTMEMLAWYLFCAKHETMVIRAIKFVIGLKEKDLLRFSYDTTSKLIAGRVKKDANLFDCKYLYPLPDFLKDYVKEIFHEFKKDGQEDMGYFDRNWHCLKRAIEIIVATNDFSLLPEIEDIILLFQEKKIRYTEHGQFYERDMHLAIIKSVRKYLYAKKRDSIANEK
ncbi:MAG: hypothetical protein A3E91_03945 [Candidatus Moranbacteria bacterium RIFCSPHIGHO2_12_FULL_40_10]|nr:MAG: hypothetical protein A3E91_03945 [Candidatus Moranbacteria bacterium RIFCSPHIGHO2_12_FULL_40_10]